MASSRHLTSCLGESFCVLPTKVGAQHWVKRGMDAGTAVHKASASRMQNQRLRYIEDE